MLFFYPRAFGMNKGDWIRIAKKLSQFVDLNEWKCKICELRNKCPAV